MEKLSFKLEVFEGPLDLLLFLISKKKLDITDIPIAELLDQYMQYLDTMTSMDMEVTSDFLGMASQLVQIKTAMLLPRYEEQEEDPRSDLIRTLLEYQTCKQLAGLLRERAVGFDCFAGPGEEPEPDLVYRRRHPPEALLAALAGISVRAKRRLPPAQDPFRVIVGKKIISVGSRIVHVLRMLKKRGGQPLHTLFTDVRGRSEAVATFMAVLELIKSRRIVVEDGAQETVCLRRR